MSVLLATIWTAGPILLRIKHAGSSLLRISVWLTLRVSYLGYWNHIISLSTVCLRHTIRSLWQVACIGKSSIVIWELWMRCSDFSFVSPSLTWPCTCILSHRRIRYVASFGLCAGEFILNHGHACVSWLNHVVILDSSKVKERFFLNRLARLLLLWLCRLETATIASVCGSMMRLLAPCIFAAILFLDECGCLVHWRVLLHCKSIFVNDIYRF